MATGINQPQSVDHMFWDWLQGFNSVLKPMLLLGATVLCWALWICRNDLVFEKKTLVFSFTGYPFDVIEALKLGHPSARGVAAVGCGGFVTLGANDHGLFFLGVWVVI
jgi:hypothetical protein